MFSLIPTMSQKGSFPKEDEKLRDLEDSIAARWRWFQVDKVEYS